MTMRITKFIWPIVHHYRKLMYPIRLRQYEQNLYSKYKQRGTLPLKQRLVLMQDDNFSHGGLVDRMKGVVSAYFLANQFDLDFSIYFKDVNDPFITLMNDKNVEVLSGKDSLCYDRNFSRPLIWYNYFPKNSVDIKRRLLSKKEIHLYCNVNLLQSFNFSEFEMQSVWAKISNHIFQFKKNDDENAIGIHLRFIGLLGDFTDLREYRLDEKQKMNMIEWCGNKILEIGMSHPDKNLKVFSDSSTFLSVLKQNEKFKLLKKRFQIDTNDIGHTALDLNGKVFKKTVDDFFGLRSCEKVFQLRCGKMHRSDFSRYAAISALKQFEIMECNAN
jgi:hypothetical protein